MAGKSLATAALAVALLVGYAAPASAGPICVFTQVIQAGGRQTDEVHFSGLGSFGVLTTGGDITPLVTVPADRTGGRQLVTGYWPVLGFRNQAQYEAQHGTVLTIPDKSVTLYSEVWNGEYGQAREVQRLYFDAVVSARVGTEAGQTAIDWQFADLSQQVQFEDAVVTVSYQPVRMPEGVPYIFFDDGSPPIGVPGGPRYYPTLLEATIDVTRAPTDPDPNPGPGGPPDPPGNGSPPGVPEPASALLAGLALGGVVVRRAAGRRLVTA